MTGKEAKEKKEAIVTNISKAYKDIEILKEELRILQKDCPHNNKIDAMGDIICSDCGKLLPARRCKCR